DVPEEYGGLAAGLTVSAILADYLAGESSFGVAWGVHTTVGTLPIVYYGTPEQKARWLPGMATGAIVGAYALTEPGAGSDAGRAWGHHRRAGQRRGERLCCGARRGAGARAHVP